MKIYWLNEERTSAEIYRGFFRKQVAVVEMRTRKGVYGETLNEWWYMPSNYGCSNALDRLLNKRRDAARFAANWRPVAPLPRATVVK